MKLIKIIFAVLLIQSTALSTWISFTAISPGMKVGYEFGKNSGLTIGGELSATAGLPYLFGIWGGAVVGIQYNVKQKFVSHYEEIEFGGPLLGFAFGSEGRSDACYFHYRIFMGMIGYCSFKSIPKIKSKQLDFVGKYSVFASFSEDHSGTKRWVPMHKL